MSSGKIIATLVGISTAVFLISQLMNKSSVATTENFTTGYPLSTKRENSTGHLPDNTFVSTCNMDGNVRMIQTPRTPSTHESFSNFAAAAGNNVENYGAKQNKSGCQSDNKLETLALPVTGFGPSEPSPEPGANGDIAAAFNTTRLMYTTLKRPQCGVDMIRGDLPIPKCHHKSMPAAGPHDSLYSGAFSALFGSMETPMKTATLIQNSTGRQAHGGSHLFSNQLTGEIQSHR